MKRIALAVILVALIAVSSFSVALAKPAVPSARDMGRGVFIDYGYSSPPWYPPEEETDSYKWAPKYYWADPSILVKVNPTASGFPAEELDSIVAEVSKGFAAWDAASGPFGASVSRDDAVAPSLVTPDGVNTVSWGTLDGAGGIIAVTYYWYYLNTKELVDCDIIFDVAEPWSISASVPSDKYDVWNIATHEAGHVLVLGDLRSPKDGALTMHAYSWWGDDLKRTLGAGDILGIRAIYGE